MPVSKKAATTSKNWDEKQEAQLQEIYTGSADNARLAEIGAHFGGKSAAAVRGKLVSMGLYEKGEHRAVGGVNSTKKIEIVNAIEIFAGMNKGALDSLEKASKPQLEALSAVLANLSDRSNAAAGIVEPTGN
jgi:hypothetical protein